MTESPSRPYVAEDVLLSHEPHEIRQLAMDLGFDEATQAYVLRTHGEFYETDLLAGFIASVYTELEATNTSVADYVRAIHVRTVSSRGAAR